MPEPTVFVRPALDEKGKPKFVPRGPGVLLRRRPGSEWPIGAIEAGGEALVITPYIKALIKGGDVVAADAKPAAPELAPVTTSVSKSAPGEHASPHKPQGSRLAPAPAKNEE